MKRYPRNKVEDDSTQRALDALVAALEAGDDTFPPYGKLFEDVLLDTTEVGLTHGLGRKPRGWIVVDRDSTAAIYRSSSSTTQRIFFTASASVVANIWVF